MPQLLDLCSSSRDRNVFNAKVVCYKLFEIDTKVIWELGFHKASLGEWASEWAPFSISDPLRKVIQSAVLSWSIIDEKNKTHECRALYVSIVHQRNWLFARAHTQSFPWLSTPSQQYNKFNRGTQYYYHIYSKPRRRPPTDNPRISQLV